MRETLRQLRDLLEPRTRARLVLAMCGSVFVAMLDTVAIALVLPLVDIATGKSVDSGPTSFIANIVGTHDPQRLTAILSIVVVTLFVLKNVGALVFSWWLLGFVFFERVRTSARILTYYLTAPYTDVSRRSAAELMRLSCRSSPTRSAA
jgi:ABC-type multidrug transport system fused ATPase/permease subunit